MSLILGISAYYHDSAVALIKNGEIIYASQEEDFAEAAATAAKTLQEEMAVLLQEKNLI